MQTFLPDADFEISAVLLDNRRLLKQRVETFQVMKAISIEGYGWQNHPAVKQWRGHHLTLARYAVAVDNEIIARRFKPSLTLRKTLAVLAGFSGETSNDDPWWLGIPAFHDSHKSNLLRKEPEWYGMYGWSVDPFDDYWWPTKNERAHV